MPMFQKQSILHENVVLEGDSPIRIKLNKIPHFTFPWHFHSEYEIIYIVEGYGIRHVGESCENFGPGDLVMMGSHLPHYWRSDDVFHQSNSNKLMNYYVLQFQSSFLSDALEKYPELSSIRQLLKQSDNGLKFLPPFNSLFGQKIAEMHEQTGFVKFINLLWLLDQMAQCKEIKTLSPTNVRIEPLPQMGERLNKLLAHINRNYQNKLTLNEIANWYGMNTSAFARYFKQKTGKTFVSYVNDLRIAFACKLMQGGNLNISQVCFECGFNNISNFNRCFKQLMNQTPSAYIAGFK
ncbi:MAG: AraC family transcriptional regulator [Breznakibacter sp.]